MPVVEAFYFSISSNLENQAKEVLHDCSYRFNPTSNRTRVCSADLGADASSTELNNKLGYLGTTISPIR